jgi:AcrR family transcriptional regulator
MKQSSFSSLDRFSTMVYDDTPDLEAKLRNVPTQARSRERLRRVLDAADEVLAREGADAFTTTRIAEAAGIPVGSVYRYFPDKEAIVEALALSYWSDFEDLVAAAAEADEINPLEDPGSVVIDALAAGFRTHPGFLTLWYGGLRTERVRGVTRPTRTAIAISVARILAVHWPDAPEAGRHTAARMVVLTGDGLLREAFRSDPGGDASLLEESKVMIDAYLTVKLGERGPGSPAR